MTAVQQYRKKPVVIEAVQLTDSNKAEVLDWIWPADQSESSPHYGNNAGIVLRTLEGDMQAKPGEYIIRGVQGEFYPCKPDIFAATYEAVTS